MVHSVSAAFDFESQYLELPLGRLHYIEQGEGQPILFLHGVPTWSYLWRNVIPYVSTDAKCYAIDFLGFGLSDKPAIDYTYQQYIDSLDAFIKAKNLENITLVMHGFGGVIGSIYAKNNPEKIKGLAYVESHVRAQDCTSVMSLPVQEVIQDIKDATLDKAAILESDFYLDKVMKAGFFKTPTSEIWSNYQRPFNEADARIAIWQYLMMLPYGSEKNELMSEIQDYAKWLCHAPCPKLLMVAIPGFILSMENVQWARNNLKNLTLSEVGEGLHYIPETNPDAVGLALHKWYERMGNVYPDC